MRVPAAALAAAALIGLAAAAPAQAAGHGAAPDRGLFLTVSGAQDTWIRGVLLTCAPEPHGNHPRAAAACAALDGVDGALDALPVEQTPCTLEYDPVTVTAEGHHGGHPIAWRKTFANACVMSASTGAVFDF